MEDSKIIDLYWARQEDAITQTQIKYGTYCLSLAHNILPRREDAQECVNDTYLAAWNSMPPHRPSILSTYLSKLTRRISIDLLRYHNRDKRQESQYALSLEELGECVSGGNSTEDAYTEKELAEAIACYLRLCSKEARQVFLGRYYYLDSVRDVAAYCGMSESKCKSLLHRTRLGLREYLQKEGYSL